MNKRISLYGEFCKDLDCKYCVNNKCEKKSAVGIIEEADECSCSQETIVCQSAFYYREGSKRDKKGIQY
jgi:hypothetical protein